MMTDGAGLYWPTLAAVAAGAADEALADVPVGFTLTPEGEAVLDAAEAGR